MEQASIGRVVCVSGSEVIAILTPPEGRAGQHARLQKGDVIKIPQDQSVIYALVAGLNVPTPVHRQAKDEVELAELELIGESCVEDDAESPRFRRGLQCYPALGDGVYHVTEDDLDVIYSCPSASSLAIGNLHHVNPRPVHVATDVLLGRHFALLGTTGSGKSCGVTLILRGLLDQHPNAHIVVLDPHNEYSHAFGDRAFVLGPENLQLPYWLLNGDEIIEVAIGADSVHGIGRTAASLLREFIPLAKRNYRDNSNDPLPPSVDTPVPYRLGDLDRLLEDAMGRLDKPDNLDAYKWLRNRLAALTRDPRYAFMFAGISVHDTMAKILGQIFRIPTDGKPMSIIDLSAVPAEIVNVVASVLLRMAFDLGVWSGGRIPILLVCEEAHRYAPASTDRGFRPTKLAMARIAKEGRKYGLSLCMVSQRPTDLDPSILSQCNTVFAFRMINDRDQEFVRSVVVESASGLLDFLPTLGDMEAIVAGQAVAVPMRIHFPKLPQTDRPKSSTALFSAIWKGEQNDVGDRLSEIVRVWRRQYR